MRNKPVSHQQMRELPVSPLAPEGMRQFDQLVTAIILQAANDFIDGYAAGLITEDCATNSEEVVRRFNNRKKNRRALPKDISLAELESAITFLFNDDLLDRMLPSDWLIDAHTIRRSVLHQALSGAKIKSYIYYQQKMKEIQNHPTANS